MLGRAGFCTKGLKPFRNYLRKEKTMKIIINGEEEIATKDKEIVALFKHRDFEIRFLHGRFIKDPEVAIFSPLERETPLARFKTVTDAIKAVDKIASAIRPSREGSRQCANTQAGRNGSIASGGTVAYCTCDNCF